MFFVFAAIVFCVSFSFAEDSLKISKIYIHPKNVFDDAVVHTPIEKKLYNFGNWYHVTTKESVIRARLTFEEGSTITKSEMQEAEKNIRALSYISDAKIEAKKDSLGNTNLYVETSDNWTFTPTISLGKPGEEWQYGAGIVENNLLGLGHTVGFFFQHTEERDEKYLLYKSSDFFIPHHKFNLILSENTDGFYRNIDLSYPFISRSKNQWAYSFAGLWSERTENFYKDQNPKKKPKPISFIEGLNEDSLSLWFFRSFGGASFKTYLGAGYDFYRIDGVGDYGKVGMQNSRLGFSIAASRIHLEKRYNLHRVKWAEDVERGYYIKSTIAKNFEELDAKDNDLYFGHTINLSLGVKGHNFLAKGQNSFYCNEKEIRDMHSMLFGEYIYKPSLEWAWVLNAQIDSWQKSSYSDSDIYVRQLYLGSNNIFPGINPYYLAGENTFAFKAEQRYFPKFEILTQVPSFAVFLTAGQATDELRAFEPRDLLYMAGIGLRISNSKSVQGIVNHMNLSWPLNGNLDKSYAPRFSFIGKFEL